MSRWKTSTLGEVVRISGGGTPSRSNPDFYGGTIPWVTPKDMKSWEITGSQMTITQSGLDNSTTRLVPKNSVLIVVRSGVLKHTIPVGLNRISVAINQDMKALQCRDGVDPDFLARFIKAQSPVILQWVRATTADNFPIDKLRKLPVPLPPLAEQRRIAEVLDQAEALRAKRRAALAQLDSLTQSIFLDLFGDPTINPKCWPKTRLKDCTAKIQIGPFGSLLHQEDYVSDGIPIVNPKHIQNGKIVTTTAESVTTQKFKELDTYHLQKDDVVMARRGEMGRCAIVGEPGPPLLCGTGSLFLRPGKTRTESLFLCAMLSSKPIKGALERLSLGQTLPNLNSRIVEELAIPLPSIPVQREFARRVKAVEELKAAQRASLAEMEALFGSLQYRAFRGEL